MTGPWQAQRETLGAFLRDQRKISPWGGTPGARFRVPC